MGLVGRYTSEIRINWVSLLTAKEGRGFCEVKGGFRREGIRRGEAKKKACQAGRRLLFRKSVTQEEARVGVFYSFDERDGRSALSTNMAVLYYSWKVWIQCPMGG